MGGMGFLSSQMSHHSTKEKKKLHLRRYLVFAPKKISNPLR